MPIARKEQNIKTSEEGNNINIVVRKKFVLKLINKAHVLNGDHLFFFIVFLFIKLVLSCVGFK